MDGTKILLSLGGTIVNGTTSQSLEATVDMIETTTKDSNGHKTYVAGEDGGTLSVEGLIDADATYSISDLRTALAAKAEIECIYGEGVVTTGERILTFNALINSLSETAPKNDNATWSLGLQITGEITESVSVV